jgi:hypothetical protein
VIAARDPGLRGGAAPDAGSARCGATKGEGLRDVQAVLRSGGGVAADQRAPGQANAHPAIPLSARVRPGGHKIMQNMPFDFPIPTCPSLCKYWTFPQKPFQGISRRTIQSREPDGTFVGVWRFDSPRYHQRKVQSATDQGPATAQHRCVRHWSTPRRPMMLPIVPTRVY